MRCDPTLKKWYRRINRKFFLDELPNNVIVRYGNEDDDDLDAYLGLSELCADGRHKYQIIINKEKNVSATIRFGTLIHEMVHIATGLRDDHGPAFETWRATLADRGIFKKGALYKGLTLF